LQPLLLSFRSRKRIAVSSCQCLSFLVSIGDAVSVSQTLLFSRSLPVLFSLFSFDQLFPDRCDLLITPFLWLVHLLSHFVLTLSRSGILIISTTCRSTFFFLKAAFFPPDRPRYPKYPFFGRLLLFSLSPYRCFCETCVRSQTMKYFPPSSILFPFFRVVFSLGLQTKSSF